jgi:hypothetical protein
MVSPVAGLTLTRTHPSGAFAAYTATERTQPVVFRARGVTIPSVDTAYLLLEMGATGAGMGVWYQTGVIKARCGSGGGSTSNTDHAYAEAAVTKGSTIDITVEFDPANRRLRMWFGEALVGNATSSQAFAEWAGADAAGYGSTGSSTPTGVPTTSWPSPLPNALEAYVNQRSTWTEGGAAEITGSGSGGFTTTGSGAGSVQATENTGTGSGGFTTGATGSGKADVSGSGSGGFTSTGSGAGTSEAAGTGSGGFSTSGSGSGAAEVAGAGAGGFDASGTGQGTAEQPAGAGTGFGSFDTEAGGAGTVGVGGTGSGGFDADADGSGGVEASGAGAGGFTATGTGAGSVEAAAPAPEKAADATITAGRIGPIVINGPAPTGQKGPASVNIESKRKDEEVVVDLYLVTPSGQAEANPASLAVSIVISDTAGGAPLGGVKFDFALLDAATARYQRTLSPADLAALDEGKVYHYNVWSREAPRPPVFRASGQIKLLPSISLPA